MPGSTRALSSPGHRRSVMPLPRLPRPSASRRSLSSAAKRGSEAVSGAKSNVSAAAGAVASATASGVSSSMSLAVAAAAFVANGAGRLRYPLRNQVRMRLPTLKDRPSEHLPQLSLEGPEEFRPPLRLHNVGLIRWISQEARILHLARPSYQARQSDTRKEEGMHWVILREACADIMSATRKCCKAYRLVECLSEAACERADSRCRAWSNIKQMKTKLFVVGVLSKMLGNVRDDSEKAENMWMQCAAGLSASLSLCAKAFASKSRGLASMRADCPSRSRGLASMRAGNRPCGSISLSLRKYRRVTPPSIEG